MSATEITGQLYSLTSSSMIKPKFPSFSFTIDIPHHQECGKVTTQCKNKP